MGESPETLDQEQVIATTFQSEAEEVAHTMPREHISTNTEDDTLYYSGDNLSDNSNKADNNENKGGRVFADEINTPSVGDNSPSALEHPVPVRIIVLEEDRKCHAHTLSLSPHVKVKDVRSRCSHLFGMPETFLKIEDEVHGDDLDDTVTILQVLRASPSSVLHLVVTSTDPEEHPMPEVDGDDVECDYSLPNMILVNLKRKGNKSHHIRVAIDVTQKVDKVYLGGFRHKLTGCVYHHASTSTKPRRLALSEGPGYGYGYKGGSKQGRRGKKWSRETQTVAVRNRAPQTNREISTQMAKPGLWVSDAHDRVMYARDTYESADEYLERRLRAIITIQSYWRGWLARKLADSLRDKHHKLKNWLLKERIRQGQDRDEKLHEEYMRKIDPVTKEDFQLVFASLEQWRARQMGRINRELDGPERKAAMCALLDQEMQILTAIGKHQVKADRLQRDREIKRMLNTVFMV